MQCSNGWDLAASTGAGGSGAWICWNCLGNFSVPGLAHARNALPRAPRRPQRGLQHSPSMKPFPLFPPLAECFIVFKNFTSRTFHSLPIHGHPSWPASRLLRPLHCDGALTSHCRRAFSMGATRPETGAEKPHHASEAAQRPLDARLRVRTSSRLRKAATLNAHLGAPRR